MRRGSPALCGLLLVVAAGCSHVRARPEPQGHEVHFSEVVITGDLELEKLNDEELFAAATSFYAAEDWAQAARYFGRIADFHAKSRHRRAALYNAGLALEKLKFWEEAHQRFVELSDPQKGTGDALDATFRVAETLYHLERYDEAVDVLKVVAERQDLGIDKRFEAQVQQGVCELESGHADAAEATLRKVLNAWQALSDRDVVDDYYPAQAQFFLGEIFRLSYESVTLDANKTADELSKDLELKAELLLSAQGHFLRTIRIGNGYWATAAGSQIGGLYQNLYEHMTNAPSPKDLNAEETALYQAELRKKIRVLITKAITIYERTLEAAERIGAQNQFVEKTRESLQKMKDLLLAEAKEEEEQPSAPSPQPAGRKPPRGGIPRTQVPRG